MAKPRLYDATLMIGEESTTLRVDILNLPYEKFHGVSPLLISGDVSLGSPKEKVLPDFSWVVIDGAFDCSYFKVLPDTILPRGITSLICKGSIDSLADLIGILPDSVQSITVKPKVLNEIVAGSHAYDAAVKFMQMYPHIVVVGGVHTLQGVMDSIHNSRPAPQKTPELAPAAKGTPEKTSDWLSTEELTDKCIAGSEIIASIDSDVLRRYIKQARSAKAVLPIRKQEMKSGDSNIVCVHKDGVPAIIEYIEGLIIADQQRAEKNNAKKKAKQKQSKTSVAAPQGQKPADSAFYVGDKQVKPVKLKKYILDSVWKDIQTECGKNMGLLRQILADIDVINIVPKKYSAGSVFYVQDGVLIKSKSIEYKSMRCICEGFLSKKSAQRIVWGVTGTKLIAQYFFASHDGEKSRVEYNNTIDTIDVETDFAACPEKYLLLSDLIAELNSHDKTTKADTAESVDEDNVSAPESVVPETPVATSEPVVSEPVVSEPVVSEPVTPVAAPKQVVSEVVPTPTVKKKRRRITSELVGTTARIRRAKDVNFKRPYVETTESEDVPESTASAVSESRAGTSVLSVKPITYASDEAALLENAKLSIMGDGTEWVDLYSLSAQIESEQQHALERKNSLLTALSQEINPAVALNINEELRNVLLEQQRLNNAQARLRRINERLQLILTSVGHAY